MTVLRYYGLVLARVSAFVAALPILGTANTPRLIKVGLAFALSFLYFGTLFPKPPNTPLFRQPLNDVLLAYVLAVAREIVLGAVLGYAFSLFLAPARIAGEFLTQGLGLSFGSLVNATGDTPAGPLPQIFELLAVLLFLGLDGHHLFFAILHQSFGAYPIGGAFGPLPVQRLIAGAAAAEEYGIMLAAPVALCLFLTSMVLAVMTRAAPQLNLYSVGFPLQLVVGLTALLVLLPNLIKALGDILGHMSEYLLNLG